MSGISTDWKTVSKRLLLENAFTNLWEDTVELPDGQVVRYYLTRKEPFSIVIPYYNGRVYLVRQYRYAVGEITLEFPMGSVTGLGPRETAVRELKEETGMTAAQMLEIGRFRVGVSRTNQLAYVYLAHHITFGEQELEPGEFIEIESFTLAEVAQMIENGTILDGPSITSFHYLETYIQKNEL